MHEPGHKKNLEEVWEEQDHMDKGTFNPKTFFYMHDMNGDGRLGQFILHCCYHVVNSRVSSRRLLLRS